MNALIESLKADARILIEERDAAERKAKQAQECLEEIQRRLGEIENAILDRLVELECDTPLADSYGG